MSTKWSLGLLAGAAAGILFLAGSGVASADQGTDGARFSVVEGTVNVRGQNGAQTATPNMPLQPGDYVSSGSRARAEVDLNGDSALRFAGGVEAHFIDQGQVQLADGTVGISVLHGGYSTTQVDTPSVTVRASAKGSYRVTILPGGGTQVTARSGQVDVVTPQHTYVVGAGKAIVATGSASNPVVVDATPVAYDSFDQFATQRDTVLAAAAPAYAPGYNAPGYDPNAYGYGGYGYAYPAAVVVAPACTYGPYLGFGFPGWGFSLGFNGGCSYYPAVAFGFGYYPWFSPWYSPWWGGYAWNPYGWGYGWGGYGWRYPWGGGYYPGRGGYYPWRNAPYRGGYAYHGYPYRNAPYNGNGYHTAGNGYHTVAVAPRNTIAAPHAAPVRVANHNAPVRDTTHAPVRVATRNAPVNARQTQPRQVARQNAPRQVERQAQPRQVARTEAPRQPVRTEPVRTEPVRTEPTRVAANDPWSRFDAERGTRVTANGAPEDRRMDATPRTDAAPRNDAARTEPARNDAGRTNNATGSDPWSRFTQTRGTVAVRPVANQQRNPYSGNGYRGQNGGYGSPNYGGSRGGYPTYDGSRGGYPTSGGSRGGYPSSGGSRPSGGSAPAHSAPSGGGGHSGGRPH